MKYKKTAEVTGDLTGKKIIQQNNSERERERESYK